MSWSYVQSTSKRQASGANAKAFTSNVIAGNLLLACLALETDTATVTSLADGVNTWTAVGALQVLSGVGACNIYYAKNVAAGATTVTLTPTVGASELSILEYSGLHATAPFDVTLTGQGTGASASSGSQAIAGANELIIGYILGNRPISAGSGFTQRENDAFNQYTFVEDKVSGTTETVVATLSGSPTIQWAAMLAAFKLTTSSSSVPALSQRRRRIAY